MRPDPKTGVPRKRKYGPWIRPLLKVLAHLRFARGRWFDPFGHTEERRLERSLAAAYEANLAAMLPHLTPANLATAVEWANLPDAIRGYGHVKRKSVDAAAARDQELRARFAAPQASPQAESSEVLVA